MHGPSQQRQQRRHGLGLARVRGPSMEPTLRDGDLLLVRWGARPRSGRLAVVRLPGGRPLSVKRLTRELPEGWWVERDNPALGVDSWLVGALPREDVLAVAVLRLWPPRRPPREQGAGRRGPGAEPGHGG